LATGLGPTVDRITIELLPKGSPLLKGPAQIKAFLTRVAQPSQQVPSLQHQNAEQSQEIAALKHQIAGLQSRLTAAQQSAQAQQQEVADQKNAWAEANGFTREEGDAIVKQWALDNKDQEAALSAFALKNYPEAARAFQSEADKARELRAKVRQGAPEQNRELLRTELESGEQSANSFQLAAQYHAASQVLEEVRNDAAQAHQEAPTDEVVRDLWLEAAWNTAAARWKEGRLAPGDEGLPALAQAADDYKSLAGEYGALGNIEHNLDALDYLGTVLGMEAERSSGNEAVGLFNQAVQAFHNALGAYPKDYDPEDWAKAQSNLGVFLAAEAERASGDEAVALFDQAVQAFHDALKVGHTGTDIWFQTQVNLGTALAAEGTRVSGDKAAALFDQASQALQDVLDARPAAAFWLEAQLSLADVDLVAGRFDACIEQTRTVDYFRLPPDVIVLGDAVRLGCEWGAGDKMTALLDDRSLQAKADGPAKRSFVWDFDPITTYFAENSPVFAPGRASWIALLNAIRNGDSAGLTAALRQLEPILQQ
jgi:tetratricopeptide (TPR) repeat protein